VCLPRKVSEGLQVQIRPSDSSASNGPALQALSEMR
jgi:hypothetical protein